MIKVDGKSYNVAIIDVSMNVEFIYKYAKRTEDYKLNYELGAVYYNQTLKFGVSDTGDANNSDYVELVKVLSTKSSIDDGTGHNVEIITPMGELTFLMYPNGIQMKLQKKHGSKSWWGDTTVKFIAVKPVESW